MNQKFALGFAAVAWMLSACFPLNKATEQPPAPINTETSEITPAPTDVSSTSSWRAVRDTRYGFGFVVPCWWLVRPIPADSVGGGLVSIANYDEAYYAAHSTKGFWDWPNGALKIEIIVMEGVDPSNSDADAYMGFVDPTMTSLISADPMELGSNTVTVATLANLINTNDPDIRIFIYRPAPSVILFVVPTPQSIINSTDFQALLNSIVLSADQEINLPAITPGPALIDASCAG